MRSNAFPNSVGFLWPFGGRTYRELIQIIVVACFCTAPAPSKAQEFKILRREVQVHGFASQGFVYTDQNNWLTMNTTAGSGAFTEFGLNVSSQLTDKLRVGAQGYDRNLGRLGGYHPSLDWAVADYRFKNWFGIRAGKVKTTLGLFNDTQDLDFLHTFALLPQSVYPTDLRESTIAHTGGDIYGTLSLAHRLGYLAYTAYAGHNSESLHSGYPYLLSQYGVFLTSLGGLQYGADLRWTTPLKGLMVGASRVNRHIRGKGTSSGPSTFTGPSIPYTEVSKADWTNQFYGQYIHGRWRIESEYRRYVRDQTSGAATSEILTDVRGWYLSGVYRLGKRFQIGSYYSRYTETGVAKGFATGSFNQTDTSQPGNHIYDEVLTGRVEINRFWNVTVEGHFMNGYASGIYPAGFYPQVNPNGYKPDTNALIAKTSFHF